MNILKPDSPVMDFLRTITNLLIVNLLFVICSLPIITFGAAFSAKYYVSMKIIRGEGTGVFIPFFKAFKRNFKQSTIVWLIMLVAIFLITFNWRYIIYTGWSNTPFIYKFGVIVFSIIVMLMTMTLFPTIARYEMKTPELFKAASHSHLSSHYRFGNRMHLVCAVVPAGICIYVNDDHVFPLARFHQAVR